MALIDLQNVGLTFRVRADRRVTFKEYLVKGLFLRRASSIITVEALHQINLNLRDGDRLGIIGHNGAGKSTLLRVLAGVYTPTAGRRSVDGKIASLFDITLGFEPEASGWENIAFRSYFQGETPRTLRGKIAEIGEFSELGDFLKMPVRYYSAGMMVRLAFAIATTIEPEILIVDEVLSVGDLSFQCKARERIGQLLDHARVVVIVSHDLRSISNLCDQVLWLDHGRMRQLGPAEQVIAAYEEQAQTASPQAA